MGTSPSRKTPTRSLSASTRRTPPRTTCSATWRSRPAGAAQPVTDSPGPLSQHGRTALCASVRPDRVRGARTPRDDLGRCLSSKEVAGSPRQLVQPYPLAIPGRLLVRAASGLAHGRALPDARRGAIAGLSARVPRAAGALAQLRGVNSPLPPRASGERHHHRHHERHPYQPLALHPAPPLPTASLEENPPTPEIDHCQWVAAETTWR